MGDDTKIQWTDATWNPVRGCSRVSEGCRNCYAEGVAARFSGNDPAGKPLAYYGLARRADNGEPRWTGEVRMVPEHLDQPIRWKKPRRIFVNSMSDLFHGKLTYEQIESVFLVMLAAPRHTYQILTKREKRMRSFVDKFCADRGLDALPPFIWLGVSVEDQANAEERIPELLATRASVRFLSAEPLLGPLNLARIPWGGIATDVLGGWRTPADGIHWVIVGGESGRNARPFDVQWARDIVDQCNAAGVAAFVKQLGARPYESTKIDGVKREAWLELGDGHGGNIAEWPSWVPHTREFPAVAT